MCSAETILENEDALKTSEVYLVLLCLNSQNNSRPIILSDPDSGPDLAFADFSN